VWSLGCRSGLRQIDTQGCRFSPDLDDHLVTDAIDAAEYGRSTMSMIRLLRRLGARVVAHYSPVFETLDGSASTIWPNVPEEIDPPRWRLDRSSELAEPTEAQAQRGRVGILHA
jgi:hypothetical protein